MSVRSLSLEVRLSLALFGAFLACVVALLAAGPIDWWVDAVLGGLAGLFLGLAIVVLWDPWLRGDRRSRG